MDLGATTDEESAVSAEDSDSADGDDDDDEEDVDDADFEEPTAAESQQILRASSCWKEALSAVRDLAALDQEFLVNSLCDIEVELNDEEPTVEELQSMFSGIRARFHEEAVEMSTVSGSEWGSESGSLALSPCDLNAEMEVALVQVRKQAAGSGGIGRVHNVIFPGLQWLRSDGGGHGGYFWAN